MLINTIDNGGIDGGFSWLGKQYALSATGNMLLGSFAIGKGTTAFEYDIYIERGPGQLVKIGLVKNSDVSPLMVSWSSVTVTVPGKRP